MATKRAWSALPLLINHGRVGAGKGEASAQKCKAFILLAFVPSYTCVVPSHVKKRTPCAMTLLFFDILRCLLLVFLDIPFLGVPFFFPVCVRIVCTVCVFAL